MVRGFFGELVEEIGIEQIAGVVQANSGIAEETAASSNDLKLQTERLNSLVNSYRFRTDG